MCVCGRERESSLLWIHESTFPVDHLVRRYSPLLALCVLARKWNRVVSGLERAVSRPVSIGRPVGQKL